MRVERPEIVEPFADADELDGQPELVGDRDRHASSRGAVELRQRDAGDTGGLTEESRLLQAVLARRRVDDEQGLVRCALDSAGEHPADLGELVHQVRLRVQPAGGVDDDDILPARARRLDGVECDRSRIGAAAGADEVGSGALGPDLELLLGGGAERVGSTEHDRAPVSASFAASLPIVVVFPVPLTPTTRITRGGSPWTASVGGSPNSASTSSASASGSEPISPRPRAGGRAPPSRGRRRRPG